MNTYQYFLPIIVDGCTWYRPIYISMTISNRNIFNHYISTGKVNRLYALSTYLRSIGFTLTSDILIAYDENDIGTDKDYDFIFDHINKVSFSMIVSMMRRFCNMYKMNMPTALVVLITGTRSNLTDSQKNIIYNELKLINENRYGYNSIFLVHGDCKGVDKYASDIATQMKWTSIPFPAEWNKHGNRAGPIRNQYMIDSSRPHITLAFPISSSRGTVDCISRINAYQQQQSNRLIYHKEISLD